MYETIHAMIANGTLRVHAIAHGLNDPTTPKNHSIDDDTVRAIRARIATGEPQSAIADDLGLTRNVVNRIVRGRTYRSVA